MPRPKKQVTVEEPLFNAETVLDKYADLQSALIKYGLRVWGKKNEQKLLESGAANGNNSLSVADDIELLPLEMKQVQYLNMKMDGIPIRKICELLEISPAMPALWKEEAGQDSVYAVCLDAIDQIQADMAEDITRDEAQTNRKANLERMFYIKRWKPEYRDNFQGANANVVQLNITLDGKPFSVDVNTKDAGSDD